MSLTDPTKDSGAGGRPGSRARHFAQYPLQFRILLSQLPLTISAVLVAVAVMLFDPRIATASPHFAVGFGGILLLTVAAGVVPWQRFPPLAYWVIPLLDFVAIAPFWSAARYVLDGMSILSAFPVFWLAWSGMYPLLGISLGFLGTAAVTWWPYLTDEAPFEDDLFQASLIRPAMVPFLILALGLAASILARSMDRQSMELKASLEKAATQNRRLHAVVDTSDVGILVVDGEGHDVLMNQAQRRLHFIGLPAGSEDGAEADLLVFEADGATPIAAPDRPVFRALQGASFQGRVIALGIDGSQQHLSVSASPMFDESGVFDGTVVIFQNITDLMDAIRTREQFVAEVSHEFRTPLTSIIGYLDLALDEDPDPQLRRYLATSIRNAERLLHLVSSLLDAQAATAEVIVQDVDLALLTRFSLESAEAHAQRSNLTLEPDLPARLKVMADPVKMGQVVDNLLSNAIKYTPDGGTITVSLRRLADDSSEEHGMPARGDSGAWAELMVQDTGIGMTEEERDRLFTNFYRTEHVRRAAIPGTGLGLAISQGYVRAHGGEILVTARKGEGSTFTVLLPVDGPVPA